MKRLVVALAVVIGILGMPPPASAVDLYLIVGVVRDNLGRPLAGVTVTADQAKSTSTSATGEYTLSVAAGDHEITTYRSDLDRGSATVTVAVSSLEVRRDFVLTYAVAIGTSPQALSTASGGASTSVTVTSGAPTPGLPGETGASCVKVRDARTGTTHDARYFTTSGRIVYWTLSLDAPQNSAEGNYKLTAWAEECASGARLSAAVAASVTYTIDNTPPEIPLKGLFPADGTNTAHGTAQPLLATVKDSLSGVLNSSIRFSLFDADGTEVFKSAQTPSTRITWNSLTGQAVSPAVPNLAEGQLHYLVVTATDKAGNSATQSHTSGRLGGGFLTTSVAHQGTSASLPGSSCSVASQVITTGAYAGMKRVTCPAVSARLATTSILLGGARHIDSGYISQTFGLDTALVSGTIGGAPATWPAYRSEDPNWQAKTRSMRYSVDLSSSSDLTAEVPAADVGLGTLVTYVPGTFDGPTAQLRMGDAAAVSSATTCASPAGSTAKVPCSPDPLDARFIVTLKAGVDVAAAVARHTSQLGVVLRSTTGGRAYSAFVPPEHREALAADPDVVGVRREGLSSELSPDDWGDTIGEVDDSAIVAGAEAQFGSRYGGSWIDRSVMPSLWRVAVKDVVPADYDTLAAITTANDRFVLHDVDHSQADYDTYVATAESVLASQGATAVGYVRDIPRQQLGIQVESITDATRDALLASLPPGLPRIEQGHAPGEPLHANRFTGLPVEGGLLLTSRTAAGQHGGACTTSFSVKRAASGGGIQYGGATAGHCATENDSVTLQEVEDDGINTTLRDFDVLWSGWKGQNNSVIRSDGAVFPLARPDQATKDVLAFADDHRRMKGAFSNSGLVIGLKACFQGTTSAHIGDNGTFDNCGSLGNQIDRASMGGDEAYRLERSWCFGPATVNKGDSGGPVYNAQKRNVKMMGIMSYREVYPEVDPWALTRWDGVPQGGSSNEEPALNSMYGCFSSVDDFESASGWSLHRD